MQCNSVRGLEKWIPLDDNSTTIQTIQVEEGGCGNKIHQNCKYLREILAIKLSSIGKTLSIKS